MSNDRRKLLEIPWMWYYANTGSVIVARWCYDGNVRKTRDGSFRFTTALIMAFFTTLLVTSNRTLGRHRDVVRFCEKQSMSRFRRAWQSLNTKGQRSQLEF